MAEIAREFGVSRERVRQILNGNKVIIDKRGSQGSRKLSTVS